MLVLGVMTCSRRGDTLGGAGAVSATTDADATAAALLVLVQVVLFW